MATTTSEPSVGKDRDPCTRTGFHTHPKDWRRKMALWPSRKPEQAPTLTLWALAMIITHQTKYVVLRDGFLRHFETTLRPARSGLDFADSTEDLLHIRNAADLLQNRRARGCKDYYDQNEAHQKQPLELLGITTKLDARL